MPLHRNEGKSNASLHRFAFWSDTDPAVTHGTGSDGVEAGQGWVQHASGDPNTIVGFFIRNEANTAWVDVVTASMLPDHTHSGDEVLTTHREEASAAYTLVAADAGKLIEFTNGSAVVVTVPPNSSVSYTLGTTILFEQGSSGPVTIQGGSGVVVRAEGGKRTTVGKNAVCGIIKQGTDEWILFGNLEASS